MSNNIKHQLQNAVFSNWSKKTDKHEYRKEYKRKLKKENRKLTTPTDKVYSTSELKALLNICTYLSVYIKENYKDFKKIMNLNYDILQGFLDYKSKDCCYNTLYSYRSYIRKLIILLNKTYKNSPSLKIENVKDKIILKINRTKDNKRRCIRMYIEDLNRIFIYSKEKDIELYKGILLGYLFGLRISEIAYRIRITDFEWDKKRVKIYKSKGGYTRYIPLEDKYFKYYNWLCNNSSDGKFLVCLTKDQLQYRFRKACKNLNITIYAKHFTSFHAIRKLYANKKYKEMLLTQNKYKAKLHVNRFLGHRKGTRKDINTAYYIY